MNFKLNNGNKIPALGFGTWRSKENHAYKAVLHALKVGYRHIDGAAVYENEKQVGQAIRDSQVARDKIFLTTKLWNSQQGYETTKKAFQQSLKKLQVDYVDLYLIHWHKGNDLARESWYAMEEFVQEGRTKSIGVSNFKQKHIESLLKTAKIQPAVNQIECNVFVMNEILHQYMKDKNILLQAYAPLASDKVKELITHPILVELSEKYQVKPSNIALRYLIQRETTPLPKSITPARIEENLNVFGFELSQEEVEKIKTLNKEEKSFPDTEEISF